ncbi:hypothetical protein ABPG72_007069 [Tetrahymena utriculariae]
MSLRGQDMMMGVGGELFYLLSIIRINLKNRFLKILYILYNQYILIQPFIIWLRSFKSSTQCIFIDFSQKSGCNNWKQINQYVITLIFSPSYTHDVKTHKILWTFMRFLLQKGDFGQNQLINLFIESFCSQYQGRESAQYFFHSDNIKIRYMIQGYYYISAVENILCFVFVIEQKLFAQLSERASDLL